MPKNYAKPELGKYNFIFEIFQTFPQKSFIF